MQLRGRALGEWTLLTALLVLLAAFAAGQGWLWRADQLLYDTGLSLNSRPVPDDIVIVAIDEESVRRIGRWPWRRAIHATLIEKLTAAEAKSVGLDIILSEAGQPEEDKLMADAIRRNGRVVLPVVPRALAPGLLTDGRPIESFRNAAAGLGHIEIQLDADGIARSIYLWGGTEEPLHPQFALALEKVSRGDTPPRFARGSASVPMGDGTWLRDLWLHPQFAGPPGTYHVVSYVDVLTGAVGAERLRNKHVLVGATATGLGDHYPTPMSELGSTMPGIEIHANILDALRTGASIEWLSPGEVAAATAVVLLALMVGLLFLSPRDGLLLSVTVGLAALVGAVLLLQWGKLWLPPGGILLGTVLAYPFWSWRRLEAAQRFLDAELRELHENDPTTQESAPERSADPLENRIAIVRAAAARQRAVRKMRDDTIRFISHDIRAPLASIIMLTDNEGDTANRLQRIGLYARNALVLADDFFRLAKAEAIDPRRFEEVDLAALVHEAADEAWLGAQKKRIGITVRDEVSGEAVVLGDRVQLARALGNLLGNAIKFSADDTTVEIALGEVDNEFELAVADQGRGIAAEDLDKLFTRYGRVGEQDMPGIGLGLVIVKTIVERHGGSVALKSEPGIGSTFRIRLPKAS
jgi:CHASE2 domain-containing sensor protein/anti-sigma regulatory factor (Ser/Thr protein kinase)